MRWGWCTAAAAGVAGLAAVWFWRGRRRWREVGRLANLYIYPLKSGRYREIVEAECTVLGLACPTMGGLPRFRDRVFVVYDEEKKEAFTARKNSKLLFIVTEPRTENSMTFSHPEKEDIEVFFPGVKFEGKTIMLWGETVEVLDCGDAVAKWFSELLLGNERGLRVGFWPERETWRRDLEGAKPIEASVFKYLSNQFTGAYSDMASFLLINESSIEDLNSKISHPEKSEILNFRPNFVIEGADPYVEDKWDLIKIGDTVFRNFRPCTRCIFTTINYKNGKKHPTTEPLTTLRTYRTMKQLDLGKGKVESSIPVMGIFLGLETPGTVRKGDLVYVC